MGQSIAHEPQKIAHRVYYLTLILASVKISNDLFLNLLEIFFYQDEVPFETYEDLYNSQLQTYSYIPSYIRFNDEPFLSKIINRTVQMEDSYCIDILQEYKNVSCFVFEHNAEIFLSESSSLSKTVPVMKIAEPPIYEGSSNYVVFADGSPYAVKFFKTLQRIEETNLMHWPSLFGERWIRDFTVTGITVNSSGIELKHLILILCIGLFTAIIVFIFEFIQFKLRMKISKYVMQKFISQMVTFAIAMELFENSSN